ncbi:RagB/SusD family nutrient uptake outer membrane protein [Pedobacter psychrodurus]|uniref:RagB/SusD family nutrient uptake outer membrane protein n=1 Tax=Pedobacter psychrodurus TaxID=2530456 RepID=A0A4V6N6K9_9SPHI|nr:RagB/SusD family nutrient uptake outer membrane protein [Pedobacter psychrodurus]TCD28157.1 RagB/SusD family nutrient uptake outer membrane protein [Pedobacter psychrodurus]
MRFFCFLVIFFNGSGNSAKILVTALSRTGSNWDAVLRPVTTEAKAAIAYRYIWSIPIDELNVNPNITQNPGYLKNVKPIVNPG